MARERLIFSDVEHVRCPNCNYRVPVESDFARFKRERQERRMPGNSRLRMQRGVAMFRAAVQEAKRKKKRKVRRTDRTADHG